MNTNLPLQPLYDAFNAQNPFDLEPHLVMLGIVGSHAHGTYLPPDEPTAVDDVDFVAIVLPPPEQVVGIRGTWTHWTWQDGPYDVVVYSLAKAVHLMCKGNPNVLSWLGLPSDCVLYASPTFTELVQQRAWFQSQRVLDAFGGYAYDQLRRMEAFDLDRMREYRALETQFGREVLALDARDVAQRAEQQGWNLDAVQHYRSLNRKFFSGYMGEKRKSVVEQFGFDVKHASHLVRLLDMAVEYAKDGELVVRRPNASVLQAIKRGKWSLEQVKHYAEERQVQLNALRAATTLPLQPDETAAHYWVARTQLTTWLLEALEAMKEDVCT